MSIFLNFFLIFCILTSSNLVDVIMTDIQVLQLFRSYSEFVRQHRHGVVRKIDFFQPIRDPRIVGKRFLRNKRYPIVTEIESFQR